MIVREVSEVSKMDSLMQDGEREIGPEVVKQALYAILRPLLPCVRPDVHEVPAGARLVWRHPDLSLVGTAVQFQWLTREGRRNSYTVACYGHPWVMEMNIDPSPGSIVEYLKGLDYICPGSSME